MFETRLKTGLFFLLKTNRDSVFVWPLFEAISTENGLFQGDNKPRFNAHLQLVSSC